MVSAVPTVDRQLIKVVDDSSLGRMIAVATDAYASASVSVSIYVNAVETSSSSLATGISSVRGVDYVQEDLGSAVKGIVLCGFDPLGGGRIEYHRETTAGSGSWILSGVYTVSTKEFVDVAYSHTLDRLFVLEASAPGLLYANMLASATQLPASFTAVDAGLAGVPVTEYRMVVGDEAQGSCDLHITRQIGLAVTKDFFVNYIVRATAAGAASIVGQETKLGVRTLIVSHGLEMRYDVASSSWLPAQVSLHGRPKSSIELVSDDTGHVYASGVADSNGDLTLTVSDFVLGDWVGSRVSGSGVIQPPVLVPFRRWGTVDPLLLGTQRPLGAYLGGLFWVGNDYFTPSLKIEMANPVADEGYHQAWLAVGSSQDVVHLGADRWYLNAPAVYATTFPIVKSDVFSATSASQLLPIADDANLLGMKVCYQWWIMDTDGVVKVGNIVEVQLRPAPAALQSQSSAKSGGSSRSKPKLFGSSANQIDAVQRAKLIKSILKRK